MCIQRIYAAQRLSIIILIVIVSVYVRELLTIAKKGKLKYNYMSSLRFRYNVYKLVITFTCAYACQAWHRFDIITYNLLMRHYK